MSLIIHAEGQSFGPYSETETQELIRTGKFKATDQVWMDKARAWTTLEEFSRSHRPATPGPVTTQVSSAASPAAGGFIIHSGGQNYGPYPADKVREFIRWGIFHMDDFAWMESANNWVRLVEALQGSVGHFARPSAPPPRGPETMHPSRLGPQMAAILDHQHAHQAAHPPAGARSHKPINPGKVKVIIRSRDKSYGPYNLNQIREFLLSGKFMESDLAWSALSNSWVPLGQILDQLKHPAGSAGTAVRPQQPEPHPVMNGSVPPPEPKRRVSGASVIQSTAKNFGPSF